ncbi:MAG: glycosyltransferase family 4 protein [Planctomycetota bacterium]|nr:glycosyltransferase family 4 protein [Planctomycetota bacterium]
MKILMTDFHRLWGGQAAYVLAVCRGLALRGHEVTVGCVAGSMLEERARASGLAVFNGCRFVKGFSLSGLPGDVSALRRFLEANGTDILHANGSQDHWAGALAVYLSGTVTRIVRTKHNSYPPRRGALNRILYGELTHKLIAVAGSVARQFAESGLLPAAEIDVVHAPVGDEFLAGRDAPRVLRREYGMCEEDVLVGFVGRLHPDKGPQVLLEAALPLLRSNRNIRLVYVGIGHLEKELPARAEGLGLAGRVNFTGFREDMIQVMASLDVLVLPSLSCDASSTVLKEAMAMGIPAVATDVGGAREIVDDGVSGLIVPPGDIPALSGAIARLAADRDLRERMGLAGREKVRRLFSVAATVGRLEEIYRGLMPARVAAGGAGR